MRDTFASVAASPLDAGQPAHAVRHPMARPARRSLSAYHDFGTTTPDTEARYQIGEVADQTGVTQRTLRFYEEKGLLTPADRMDGGFRLYSDEDVVRIRLIKQLQGLLGFSLAEIKEMVETEAVRAHLRATPKPSPDDRAALRARGEQALSALRRQLDVVEPKLEQLKQLRTELRERIATIEQRIIDLDAPVAVGAESRS
ncbi:MAG: MerR family transcriptional regulator [Chloroflexi bacterium]|nr:MAG: MerR family transcriptional regulator [Chloroflexota bacterium]